MGNSDGAPCSADGECTAMPAGGETWSNNPSEYPEAALPETPPTSAQERVQAAGGPEPARGSSAAAPFVYDTSAGIRHGPEIHSGVAGAQEFQDHRGVHACQRTGCRADSKPAGQSGRAAMEEIHAPARVTCQMWCIHEPEVRKTGVVGNRYRT